MPDNAGIKRQPRTESHPIHQPIAPRGCLRTFVDRAEGVSAGRGEGMIEPTTLQPEPHLKCQVRELAVWRFERRSWQGGSPWMQFEIHPGKMVFQRFRQPGQIVAGL